MKNLLVAFVVVLSLLSCVSNGKIADAKNKLNGIKDQMQKETAQINGIKAEANDKLLANRIDSNILLRIQNRLHKSSTHLDSAGAQAARLDAMLSNLKTAKRNYKKMIIPALDSLQMQSNQYAQRLGLYLMMQEGLNVADFKLFDLAAFFGPGKYIIPEDKIDIAAQSFSPVIDSLMLFSNKYSQYSRTATLIILGFADATGYTPGSPLYYTLLDELGKPEATKEELNQKISELRSKELIKQLTNLYLKKASGFTNADKLHIEYLGQGKGEKLPQPSIKDYKEDDERRRIVLCYWVVLPD
jgi:hypothetical protein